MHQVTRAEFSRGPRLHMWGWALPKAEGWLSGTRCSGWNPFMLRELFIGKGLILKPQQALVFRKGGRDCHSVQGLLMGRKRQRGFFTVCCDPAA